MASTRLNMRELVHTKRLVVQVRRKLETYPTLVHTMMGMGMCLGLFVHFRNTPQALRNTTAHENPLYSGHILWDGNFTALVILKGPVTTNNVQFAHARSTNYTHLILYVDYEQSSFFLV